MEENNCNPERNYAVLTNVTIEHIKDNDFFMDTTEPEHYTEPPDNSSNFKVMEICDISPNETLVDTSQTITRKTDENTEKNKDSSSKTEEEENLYAEDVGPHWYKVENQLVTRPIKGHILPKLFEGFPIFDKPPCNVDLDEFHDKVIRDFVGCDLDDADYEELKNYCSTEHLKTGKELQMASKIPTPGAASVLPNDEDFLNLEESQTDLPNLFVLRKLRIRKQMDPDNTYAKKLKYRGVRLLPMSDEEGEAPEQEAQQEWAAGRDVLYRLRIYRPFTFSYPRDHNKRGRPTVFSSDLIACGRQSLRDIRSRLLCRNDLHARLDVADDPTRDHPTRAKEMFPKGFLFINNVFYIDSEDGGDCTAALRAWAVTRGMGQFPVRDMAKTRLIDIPLRLAHPEVYVHQGNCEHMFMFSEISLLPASLARTPLPRARCASQLQTVYCTTCAEFGAAWLVQRCRLVPFDPAFFCDTCFKSYLYRRGKKLHEFSAYRYRGAELAVRRPVL